MRLVYLSISLHNIHFNIPEYIMSNGNDPSQPPKKKRKRTWSNYEEFISIITKLGKDYPAELFACLEYNNMELKQE